MAKKKQPARERQIVPIRAATGADLVTWIAVNVPPKQLLEDGHKSLERAAAWFCACQEAQFVSIMSARELASLLMDPPNLNTLDGLTASLGCFYSKEDDPAYLEAFNTELCEFWGLT